MRKVPPLFMLSFTLFTCETRVVHHFLLVVFVCLSFFVSPLNSQESGRDKQVEYADIRARISAIWDMQRSSLRSGTFQCRTIRRKVPEGLDITQDEVRALLTHLSQSLTPRTLTELAVTLYPRSDNTEVPWSEQTYTFDGKSATVHESIMGNSGRSQTHTKHKEYEVIQRPVSPGRADQITVLSRGEPLQHIPNLSDFVFIPSRTFVKEARIVADADNQSKGRITLSRKLVRIIADEDSGFVFEFTRGDYGERRYMEMLQFRPMTFDQGIVLPEIRFIAQYGEKRLMSFDLRVIDQADLNIQVPESVFRIAANEENIVVDQTKSKPRVVRDNPSVVDVTKLVGYEAPIRDISLPGLPITITAIIVIILFVAVLAKHFRNRADRPA